MTPVNPYSVLAPYDFRQLVLHLAESSRISDLRRLLTDLRFLEVKAERGMAYSLIDDFAHAVRVWPRDDPTLRMLRLLNEAIRLNISFISRHPSCLFQCLWNNCWWYDCPEAARHYGAPQGSALGGAPPWEQPGPRLSAWIESWREAKEKATPGFHWLRSLRPPAEHLGGARKALFRGHADLRASEGTDPFGIAVAFSPDGQQIVSAGRDGTVRVWDVSTGAERLCLPGGEEWTCVAFSPDGQRIVGCSVGEIQVWAALNGATLWRLDTRKSKIEPSESVAFSPDGKRIVSGDTGCASGEYKIRLWDANTGAELRCLEGHEDWVSTVAFSPNGEFIVSGSWDGTVRIWDANSGEELRRLKGHEEVSTLAVSHDGARIISGGGDILRIWDTATGSILHCWPAYQDEVASVGISPDDQRIVSGGKDMTLCIREAATGTLLHRWHAHQDSVSSVAFSPDGKWIGSGGKDATVLLWAIGEFGFRDLELQDHEAWIRGVVFSPDGGHIATGGDDGTVRIWDAVTGVHLRCLRGHRGSVLGVAFSPDGKQIASGGSDLLIRVWDVSSGTELRFLQGQENPVTAVAFSPNGQHIVSGSTDYAIRVWDALSGAELKCFRGNHRVITTLAYSPDGQKIADGGRDNVVYVRDAASGDCVQKIHCLAPEDIGDVIGRSRDAARTAGWQPPPSWRAIRRELEMVIESADTGEAVAWLPETVDYIATHPSGRMWAVAVGSYLCLFRLEGR